MTSQLRRAGATLNFQKKACSTRRPCKVMTCNNCVERRKLSLVTLGGGFARQHNLDRHIIITWPLQDHDYEWEQVLIRTESLSRKVRGRIGLYIRTLGIGRSRRTPHIHYLLDSSFVQFLCDKAREDFKGCLIKIDPVTTPEGLLGYFFDQNYLPAVRDPQRPKRIRILSGSHGIPYGYPSAQTWRKVLGMTEWKETSDV